MFTFNGRDAHRTLPALKLHLPFARPIGDILPEKIKTEDDEADAGLQRLPAPGLRGTWARAYAILTRLVSQIGWDELLKARSLVFVMEEEYRMQKAQSEIKPNGKSPQIGFSADSSAGDIGQQSYHEDGRVELTRDDASTRAFVEPDSPKMDGTSREDINGNVMEPTASIPVIRISTESDRDARSEGAAEDLAAKSGDKESTEEQEEEDKKKKNGFEAAAGAVEKPVSAVSPPQATSTPSELPAVEQSETFSFSNKRLCERWLDNLFMVLYEDLRVWTIFRAEVAHFKTQHVSYRKTALEWELLGDLGLRLHHREEAKEAYQRCLDSQRYSIKPWLKLMETYAEEGDIQRCVQTAIRVAAYQWADYTEMAYPTAVAKAFLKLGSIHGLQKIQFTLLSLGLPAPILKIMESYLNYGRKFRVEGSEF